MKKSFLLLLLLLSASATMGIRLPKSLVPITPSQAPDYFCTWNIQGYVVSCGNASDMRSQMNERRLFSPDTLCHWATIFPRLRNDLYFVLDDTWDVPADDNRSDNPWIGRLELDETRFPSFKGTATERMKHLADSIVSYGWKGLGLWICAQQAQALPPCSQEEYWNERLQSHQAAGVRYWKVDWGREDHNDAWRRMLADNARRLAPDLMVEHAMKKQYVAFSDAYRTYDVENIISQPVTISRVVELLGFKAEGEAKGIINCEDEPYIAAGLGCAVGMMRHAYPGVYPSGKPDYVFPSTIRDLKRRIDEVERLLHWHRIAEPFGVDGDYTVDDVLLEDNWIVQANETWVDRELGKPVFASAPARVSRRMPLPEVSYVGYERPYLLASRYPNGAVALAAIGRTLGREYICHRVGVSIEVEDITKPIGLFGPLGDVTLKTTMPKKAVRVLAQDLKGDRAIDITSRLCITNAGIVVPADVIREVGLMAATPGDLSDPGMVLQIF